MNTFALEIWYDEGSVCTFYTVKWITDEDDLPSETDKFFDKYAIPTHKLEDEALKLFRLITESIGNKYGATNDFFDRPERNAQALPPKPKNRVEELKDLGFSFPLRLYCYRVTEQIVILFNGGIKESETAQGSPSLSMKFHEAQAFVKKREEALRSKMIRVSKDKRHLLGFNDETEIILN